jgi:hypothetical protein
MISETGKNLFILIVTESGLNWETFATWYSFYTNLPDCKIHIYSHRNKSIPFQYFQWAKRLKIPCTKNNVFSEDSADFINNLNAINICQKNKLVQQPLLVVKPYTMVIDTLNKELLDIFNNKTICVNENIWFLNHLDIEDIFNNCVLNDSEIYMSKEKICFEAKETDEPKSIVSYNKGCGRWINKAKGCPFSNAGGLVTPEMTSNESKIINMWKKMVPLYQAVV